MLYLNIAIAIVIGFIPMFLVLWLEKVSRGY